VSATAAATVDCVAGVDGGGSKTACLLASASGEPLGEGRAGPSNYQSVGAARTLDALHEAIAAAAAAAGGAAHRLRVAGLCLALAGVDRPDDLEAVRALTRDLLARPPAGVTWDLPPDGVVIVNDAVAALVGGTGRTEGVVCVAGTGSIVFGMNRAGRRSRAGGWGHLLGDEGSGYAIGLAALRAVCRAADGRGPETTLTRLVLDECRLSQASGLIGLAYGGWGVPQIASLAPLAGAAAATGDAVAVAILDAAAAELAGAAGAVARDLGLLGAPGEPVGDGFEVVTSGGLWTGLTGLRERFAADLGRLAPGANVIGPRHSPVEGAVLLARRAAGWGSLE
jgi:N-acetylglucosamine kinase